MDFLLYLISYIAVPLCLYHLFFFILALLSALCVLAQRFENPIYSVLTLALVFMLTAFTLLLLSVEFLAYVYVIVYVGAVVLLFVFIVFMLGPVYEKSYRSELPVFFYLFTLKFSALFSVAVWDFVFFTGGKGAFFFDGAYVSDIVVFSNLLYTEHAFLL
jgi:NADH:ubiquinone oxidoreductase subunit 6 (subunit J)